MEDWLKIKTEYITTDTSYRKLAEKYGVPKNRIAEIGKKEGWSELRGQFRDKTVTKIMEKTSENKAKQAAKVGDLAGRLLIKLEKAIEEIDQTIVTHKVKTRDIEYGDLTARGKPTHEVICEEEKVLAMGSLVDRTGLYQLAATLQRLQIVTGEVTDLERREREARIANLRKQADPEQKETATLIVEGLPEEFRT